MAQGPESLVDPWRAYQHPLFYQRVGLLNPADRWDVLTTLRSAEIASPESRPVWERLLPHFRERLALSPMHAVDELDELAVRAVGHALNRNLHTTAIIAALAAGTPIDAVVDVSTSATLRSAVAARGSAIVLPVHARAIEAGVFALSRVMPTTLVVSQTAGIPDDTTPFEDLVGPTDLQVLRAPDNRVLVRCVKAARSGRVLVLPPEFTSNDHDMVIPYELAGRQIGVPSAYVELARRLDLPLVPMLFEQGADSGYQWILDGPFEPDDLTGGVPTVIGRVFAMVEAVLSEDPTEWEGWYMFDRMIADGERLAMTPAAPPLVTA